MEADTLRVARRSWRAMGSDAEVIVVGASSEAPDTPSIADVLAQQAVARVAVLESRWSRFLPTSEVSRLNDAAGSAIEVSADTVVLVTLAVEAWRLTGGAFDPTVLSALQDAGYDDTIDVVRDRALRSVAHSKSVHPARRRSLALVGCTDIEVSGRAVALPRDTAFDAGGIGKGLAADLVLDELMRNGAAGACVNLGGDLRVAGISPTGDSWTLSIEHPLSPEPLALVGLAGGAVASSTTLLRRWEVDGARRHHLIDPQTGAPSDSDVEFASVIAAEAWEAEVLAKAVLLRGSARAFDLLVPGKHAALIVDRQGVVTVSEDFANFGGRPRSSLVPRPH